MNTQERHLQDRLGSALFRLASIEQKTNDAPESPRAVAKLLAEMRKLTGELQRSFQDLQDLIKRNLASQHSAAVAVARAELLFELSPVASLLLEPIGVVVDANAAAARLLNVSHRHLVGKAFPLFLASERDAFIQSLAALAERDDALRWKGTLRPRERSAVPCTVIAAHDPQDRVLVMIVPGEIAEEAGIAEKESQQDA